MIDSVDMFFSLGPNCKSTWNLRKFHRVSKAYPFDWWITPAKAALNMLRPDFLFHVAREDLVITPTMQDGVYLHNTVYNKKLNILHHHDFARNWEQGLPGVIFETNALEIDSINQKYTKRFQRLHRDIRNSIAPVAVVNGVNPGFQADDFGCEIKETLNGFIDSASFANEARSMLGTKLRILDIRVGDKDSIQEFDWGWIVVCEDNGERELADGHFAEPVNVFRRAYQKVGLNCFAEG